MGSDRDGKEFFDAAGKRRTARECSYRSDEHDYAAIGERFAAQERTAQRGSGLGFERGFDGESDAR